MYINVYKIKFQKIEFWQKKNNNNNKIIIILYMHNKIQIIILVVKQMNFEANEWNKWME